MDIQLPVLTEYDPVYTAEGSLDPLGLYPIADRLAVRLVPGFRERMAHPRFLTMMALGAVICSDFDEDEIGSDGISEPWQVYEWYVVQALTKKFHQEKDEIRGLPGREKALNAYKQKLPLNATRYLKTATVFGFHGVYRTLAKELNLLDAFNNLGEFGHELVQIWEKEQKMEGFYISSKGPGRHFRERIYKSVREGLDRGEVVRKWSWGFFNTIAEHLAPYRMGKKERETIYKALINESAPLRRELLLFLKSSTAQKIWQIHSSEKMLHKELLSLASEELRQLLLAILNYEHFCRLLQNAFEAVLYYLSENSRGKIKEMAELEPVKKASFEIKNSYENVLIHLEPFGENLAFNSSFRHVIHVEHIVDWLHSLLEHHQANQKRKPPAGKKPWCEKVASNEYIIYPKYKLKSEPEFSGEYVNYYRTNPLLSFLQDLKVTSDGS